LHPLLLLPLLLVEPPELEEPPVLEEPATHEPFMQVALDVVQSVHIPPPVPQVVSPLVWQVPVPSQQPVGHDVELQLPPSLVLEPPLLVLEPPLLVLDPPLLVLDPPPLVLDALVPPPLLPLPLPSEPPLPPPLKVEKPPSRLRSAPSELDPTGPPVAHANATPPSESKTMPRAANRPRKCILSI
jgi:hypothetical protein